MKEIIEFHPAAEYFLSSKLNEPFIKRNIKFLDVCSGSFDEDFIIEVKLQKTFSFEFDYVNIIISMFNEFAVSEINEKAETYDFFPPMLQIMPDGKISLSYRLYMKKKETQAGE